MSQRELDTLLTRITVLEKRQGRLAFFLAGSCALAGLLAFVGPPAATGRQQDNLKAVDANVFRIRGEDGKIKAMFGISENGAALYFMDDKGKRRMTLEGTTKGGSIGFHDAGGTLRALLVCEDKNGALILRTEGPGGMHLSNDGIRLLDKAGKARASLVQAEEGNALLGIMDQRGNITFSSKE